ncbi:unnamed protein product [marine sediment metagenome]|uniref:Uncharacterized protein n=1 Tax=marine sediment metagenome TaxID=412755 RepID=X0TKL4_9ZZZZ
MRSLSSAIRADAWDEYNSKIKIIPDAVKAYDILRKWAEPSYQTRRLGRWSGFLLKKITVTYSRSGFFEFKVHFTDPSNFVKWTNIIIDELFDDLNTDRYEREWAGINKFEDSVNFYHKRATFMFLKGGMCHPIYKSKTVKSQEIIGYEC